MRAPSRQDPTPSLTTQGASIAATGLATVTSQGLYRITYYVRVTRAATTSSYISLALSWVDGGVTQTADPADLSGVTALTGNTVTSYGTGTYLVYIDAGTTPTYATTYASTGATSMQYRLAVVMEQVMA